MAIARAISWPMALYYYSYNIFLEFCPCFSARVLILQNQGCAKKKGG
jgi:hypothetical protein